MGLILGDGKRILDIVDIAAKAAPTAPPPKFLHGMWAFGLEQQGRYEDAEAKAREGLAFEDTFFCFVVPRCVSLFGELLFRSSKRPLI